MITGASDDDPSGISTYSVAGATAALEDARQAGLLEGEKTAHVSFRAPPALVAAARRESGVTSLTELGILALAMLAQPDPVAAFFKDPNASKWADDIGMRG